MWISLYYVAFYIVMTGLFALCIYTLMQTIDPYTPDYQDQLKSPGRHQEAETWQRHGTQPVLTRRPGVERAPRLLLMKTPIIKSDLGFHFNY